MNTKDSHFIMTNPIPASDGERLYIASVKGSHGDTGRLHVYAQIPDESGARPDWTYTLPHGAWGLALPEGALAVATRRAVYAWDRAPGTGELPDRVYDGGIGDVTFAALNGITMDGRYFYVSDRDANKIYVWEGLPDADANPKLVLEAFQPYELSSDGRYLVAGTVDRGYVYIYRVDDLATPPVLFCGSHSVRLRGGSSSSLRPSVDGGHLFLPDVSGNRVLVWRSVDEALAGAEPDAALGAPDFQPQEHMAGRDRFYNPAFVSFDGRYLWVGEYKFSQRVLRFSVQP